MHFDAEHETTLVATHSSSKVPLTVQYIMIAQGYQSILTPRQKAEAEALLNNAGLSLPKGTDMGTGFYEDGDLVGVGFLAGNVICGLCVNPSHRGDGIAAALVGILIIHALNKGFSRVCITTKAAEAEKFAALGFDLVTASPSSALLEFGNPRYAQWATKTRQDLQAALSSFTSPAAHKNMAEGFGCVIMNANPFTLGHRELVMQAHGATGKVVVFVVEEEASTFPFALRHALVSKGLADIHGVVVLPGGPYIISRASFPSYFTGKEVHAAVHASLDATLFATRLAPDMEIHTRFVGAEPLCPVTALYNATLAEILPRHGVTLTEIPRCQSGDAVISASRVRQLMMKAEFHKHPEWFYNLVPPSTLEVLLSEQGIHIAKTLCHHRH